MIPMDPILIEQVLSNLMENAVIHGGTTSQVRVSVQKESSFARFSIWNDGQEIPAKDLPALFDGTIKHNEITPGDGKRNMGLGLSQPLVVLAVTFRLPPCPAIRLHGDRGCPRRNNGSKKS